MDVEFNALINVEKAESIEALELPRARALAEAVIRQRDFSIIELCRHEGGTSKLECVIVDVECDGVPPNNSQGINYRERLALCVPEDQKQLVEVLALRKGFPTILHQHQVVPGAAASLCLYYEPAASVLRTWTPQKFLRRIQWWLEASSKDQLHASDQQVEQLFFVTKYELVLPWNFDELRKNSPQKFFVNRHGERPDNGETFFLTSSAENGNPKQLPVAPIELTLSPILQGQVERDPATLGDLSDILLNRGADIIDNLRKLVQARVGDQGIAATADEAFTIILLHVPVCRTPGGEPERIFHRAFFIPLGSLKLGSALGALFFHDNKYFRSTGLLGGQESNEWRVQQIFPMEVLRCNSPEMARNQSGILDTGPNGVLIGAGSLGSAMLNLWGRSGWGQWTVVDKDHIKPHNLSRHVALAHQIGATKTDVAAELHDAAMQGASRLTGIFADACDTTHEKVWQTLHEAQLVIDASTTLEYPRLASTNDAIGRHFSVFVTPDGNSAVLLAENADRSTRLRTLEAQYYRALINQDWGSKHLDGNLATFWSGASCRDISTVMPYSRITGHAGNLAEQVQQAASRSDALIRVWDRNAETGAVVAHDVPVASERSMKFDELGLFVDAGIEEKLRAMRLKSFPTETGGILLGYYDFNINSVVIVDALPAPTDSKSSRTSFERGVVGLATAVEDAAKRTAGVVGYLGEWHSHPPGHSGHPSQDDILQLVYLALGMADDGLPAVSLIVGEHDIQILQGEVRG